MLWSFQKLFIWWIKVYMRKILERGKQKRNAVVETTLQIVLQLYRNWLLNYQKIFQSAYNAHTWNLVCWIYFEIARPVQKKVFQAASWGACYNGASLIKTIQEKYWFYLRSKNVWLKHYCSHRFYYIIFIVFFNANNSIKWNGINSYAWFYWWKKWRI